MKKVFLTIIVMVICIGFINAQSSVSFGYDKDVVLPKLNDYERLLGADSDGFYALRVDENDDIYLDYFNATTMAREASNQMILPMVSGINARYIDMFFIDSKLLLFTEVLNNTTKEKSLYIQQVGKNAHILGEPTVIGKLTNQNISVDFNIKLTPNKQNVFIWYNRPFQTYNEEPFYFKVYDSNMKEIYNNTIKLPLNNKAFEIDQIEIGNSGNIYMLARISPDPRQLKRMKTVVYDYKILVFDAATGNVNGYDTKGKKMQLVDVIFGLDTEENIDIYGFLVRKGKTNYEGIHHQKLNTKTGQFFSGDAKKADYTFSKTELPEFRAERLSRIMDQLYDYKLLDVVYLANGGSAIIAEHQNYWMDSIIVPQTKEVIYNDYYKFNDVLVAYCSPENNMEWMTRIPKSQYSYNDWGKFSSIAYYAVGEKIFLFYNDNAKNLKLLQKQDLDGTLYKEITSPGRSGMAVSVSIFSDGKIHGTQLFAKNKKYKLIPEFVKEYNYRLYMMAQNGQKVKFAQFTGR
ncbi:MAG: hypothetical protein LBQ22_06210 [Bacteroidales bacterium]|nr:hypothetical protein [Bacteroidales bacterium]